MALHVIIVSDQVKKQTTLKASLSASKKGTKTGDRIYHVHSSFTPPPPPRLLCYNKSVIINQSDGLFSIANSVIDTCILIVTAYILKLLYSWWFIDPSEHHYTTKT